MGVVAIVVTDAVLEPKLAVVRFSIGEVVVFNLGCDGQLGVDIVERGGGE